MKILAIEHELPGAKAEDFQPLLEQEAVDVWKLYKRGLARELYFRADRHEAVLMMECGSAEEAAEILQSLPLVQAGLIEFEIIPLMVYDGFERVFKEEAKAQLTPPILN